MKTILSSLAVAGLAACSVASTPNFYDSFDGYGNGMTFTSPTNGWQASDTTAYVTNSGGYAGNAVYMSDTVALSNRLAADPGLMVWTDMRIKPVLGREQANPSTNTSSFHAYFNGDGYLTVAGPTGWSVYSNDVWGTDIPPATNGYVRLSLWQNFSASTQAVFLDERLIAQDLRFAGNVAAYSNLVVQNLKNSCWLDNVRVTTNFSSVGLNSNLNADAMTDAQELQTFGYAMRTLHLVLTLQPGPYFTNLQEAVNAARPRDLISIESGSYAGETVTISQSNIAFTGNSLVLAGLTLASGASVTFSQSVYCADALGVTGQMTMASGTVLTSAVVAVTGSLTMGNNGVFSCATATVTGTLMVQQGGILQSGTLIISGIGQVNGTATHLVVPGAGVNMTSTFNLTSGIWGAPGLVSMPLPFVETFDDYAANTIVTNLKFRGWYASDETVTVQTDTKHSAPNAVVVPVGKTISNYLAVAGTTKIWTDFYLRPVLGTAPSAPETNSSSFLAYVNTNGYLVVAVEGGAWVVCSNNAVAMQNNRFSRITFIQEWGHHTFAVFVDSNLVSQGLSFPAPLTEYRSLVVKNPDQFNSVYVDNMTISSAVPGSTSDSNGNNVPDAIEINLNEVAMIPPAGCVFKIR